MCVHWVPVLWSFRLVKIIVNVGISELSEWCCRGLNYLSASMVTIKMWLLLDLIKIVHQKYYFVTVS